MNYEDMTNEQLINEIYRLRWHAERAKNMVEKGCASWQFEKVQGAINECRLILEASAEDDILWVMHKEKE